MKEVFQKKNAWFKFFNLNSHRIRDVEVETVVKILSCGLISRGFHLYRCSNRACEHTKKIPISCNSRSCPTCGKRAIDEWIEKTKNMFPDCSYQHITFTMPDVLWPIFRDNRDKLNDLIRIATQTLMDMAKKEGVTVGIFAAIHTYGRELNWNTHVHASVTMGGLDIDRNWKEVNFKKDMIMRMWRYGIITMIRSLIADGYKNISKSFVTTQYERPWLVHFDKPTKDYKHTISYIGRYTKKPPIAMSKILAFTGTHVTYKYLNHRTKKYNRLTIPMDEFFEKFIQHIPEKGFRMTRYYGLFANAVRGKLLPRVYEIFKQVVKEVKKLTYQQMSLVSFGHDPLRCIVCSNQLVVAGLFLGKTTKDFLECHTELATRKRLPR